MVKEKVTLWISPLTKSWYDWNMLPDCVIDSHHIHKVNLVCISNFKYLERITLDASEICSKSCVTSKLVTREIILVMA